MRHRQSTSDQAARRPSPLHRRALALAEAGQNGQALARLQEHLLQCPRDADALNDAGAILHALGRYDQAARHLRAALRERPDWPHQVVWNLAEVYLAAGRGVRAAALLEELAEADRLTADLANHVAMRLLQNGDAPRAVEAFLCSFRVEGDQPMLAPLYHRARRLRPKIAFFYDFDDLSFAEEIYAFVHARFDTRLCGQTDPQRIADLMHWCDIAWFEWCGDQIVAASHMPKTCRIICRLHAREAYMSWPASVHWQNVDVLVTVGNSSIRSYLRQTCDRLGRSTRLVDIPNAIDVDAYRLAEGAGGKDLACLSRTHCVENFALLLQCFHRLRAMDGEYRLHLADPGQRNGMLMQYMHAMVAELGLTDAVRFDGMPESVSDWLQDKHYIVSCSVHEGHPISVLEGLACGLTPVIHTWPGVRDFFPQEFLFRTVEEFCDRVLAARPRGEECRRFVAERFGLDRQLAQINDLFVGLERELAPAAAAAGGATQ